MYFQRGFERAFGTFPLKADELREALEHALDAGYRAIDTAQMYGNEHDIGPILQSSDIPREQLCLTSKVPPEKFSKEQFIPSVEQSLEHLCVDKLDVLLLHWPPQDGQIEAPLELLLEARQRGLTEHIGTSNFTARMLRRTIEICKVPVATNQVEFHPLLNQDTLRKAAAETGIPLSSYCSVARGEVFKQQLLHDLAADYEVTPAQVVLRWILQKGVSINTMSTKPENIKANFDVLSFTLSHVDMARVDALTQNNYRIVDKNLVPWAPDWD